MGIVGDILRLERCDSVACFLEYAPDQEGDGRFARIGVGAEDGEVVHLLYRQKFLQDKISLCERKFIYYKTKLFKL